MWRDRKQIVDFEKHSNVQDRKMTEESLMNKRGEVQELFYHIVKTPPYALLIRDLDYKSLILRH